MGGQACVLYGAAEYSRDLDLAVLATRDALTPLKAALDSLKATVIAVPELEIRYLERGHGVHFSVPDDSAPPLRVDIMSRMRGIDNFDALWARRTTIALPGVPPSPDVVVDVMALEDLVAAKKTQRDKDWPMLRRLVDAHYASNRDAAATDAETEFWLSELRTPAFLQEAAERFSSAAAQSTRPAVIAALGGGDVDAALATEQATEVAADRAYWAPLRRELEQLRHDARRR
jgi:hypothetical protein